MTISGLEVNIEKRANYKNTAVKVIADGSVRVTAPKYISDVNIKNIIEKNLREIKEVQKNFLEKNSQYGLTYENGTKHYLWGRDYTLEIVKASSYKVQVDGSKIVIFTPYPTDIEKNKRQLEGFYRKELMLVTDHLVRVYSNMMGLKVKEYRIKNMKTRWGTCNATKRRIWINLQLARWPLYCLEYVVVHELAHFFESKHNEEFYSIVEKYFPKWREAENQLKRGLI